MRQLLIIAILALVLDSGTAMAGPQPASGIQYYLTGSQNSASAFQSGTWTRFTNWLGNRWNKRKSNPQSQVQPSVIQINPAPTLSATAYKTEFLNNNGRQIVQSLLDDTSLWDSKGSICQIVSSQNGSSLPAVSAISGFLDSLLRRAGSSGNDLDMINFGRIANQPYSVSYQTVHTSGWRLAPKSEAEFHQTNVPDNSLVEKYVHSDGREYVFYNDPSRGPYLLNDGTNDGTYNYAVYKKTSPVSALQHIVLDVLPWIVMGATPEDQTSINQRLDMFTQSQKWQSMSSVIKTWCG